MIGNVLIIDDDIATCEILQVIIERMGHAVVSAGTLTSGLHKLKENDFDVVFLDVNLPDGDGLEYIHHIQSQETEPEVVVITGAGSRQGAELAIRNGAWDYLLKPLSPKNILLPVKRVLEYRSGRKKHQKTRILLNRENIIGDSIPITNVLKKVAIASGNMSNVLLFGETGTGKEIIAKTLHENSDRCNKNFVVVDCASLPRDLVESTLFGHVKGSFSGAEQYHKGLVEAADGGTLFIDEIGELNLELQKVLLRVIQEKTYFKIGSEQELKSDFRLIAATNRDLKKMVNKGSFREDLLFRISSTVIELPALRERREDIEKCFYHFLNQTISTNNLSPKGVAPEVLELINDYDWPGNVRELKNVVEQTVFNSQNYPILYAIHLPESLRMNIFDGKFLGTKRISSSSFVNLDFSQELPSFKDFKNTAIAELEKQYLFELMAQYGKDISRAQEIAGIGKTRLYDLLKKHEIKR